MLLMITKFRDKLMEKAIDERKMWSGGKWVWQGKKRGNTNVNSMFSF